MTASERFVFDTNVLVSALVFPGSTPRQAFDLAIARGAKGHEQIERSSTRALLIGLPAPQA
jgi:hypothetical protein